MTNLTSVPDFDEISIYIKERVDALRAPAGQWADLARCAIQGLPHDARQLASLERHINSIRAELRSVVLAASEHFTEEELTILRKRAGMSKHAWRSFKKNRAVTTRNGFSLVIY